MKYQERNYSCGAASIVNALRTLGKRVNERAVRKLASTDENGTSGQGIMSAVRALGYQVTEYVGVSRHHSWRWLHGAISQGAVVILSVDLWQHWVSIIAVANDRIVLVDSTNTLTNKRENGIHVLSKDRLMERWRSSNNSTDTVYHAICISKGK